MTALPRRSVVQLLAMARRELARAAEVSDLTSTRYGCAYMAALRAAAAVLTARPDTAERSESRAVWGRLTDVAPEFAEWAVYFAGAAQTSAAAEAGIPGAVSRRDADRMFAAAEQFVAAVETTIGQHADQTEGDTRA